MPDNRSGAQQPVQPEPKPGAADRFENFLTGINKRFHFFVSLPVVTAVGSLFATHFQYTAEYHDKVKEVGMLQRKAAEDTFTDVATRFATAVTLQQVIYFHYRGVASANTDTDEKTLEAKSARALYPKYDELHTSLLESIDLLARRVEMNLDWASDPGFNAAKPGDITDDPLSRIALGNYNFDCDERANMPFDGGKTHIDLKAMDDSGHARPNMRAIGIDWYSAKHELLTLYYCFQINHYRLKIPLQWAAASTLDKTAKEKFNGRMDDTQESLDQEAVRLHYFLKLGSQRIEGIRAKFRPRKWYCHMPLVRQVVDFYSKACTPIRTAQNGSVT